MFAGVAVGAAAAAAVVAAAVVEGWGEIAISPLQRQTKGAVMPLKLTTGIPSFLI